MRAPLRCSPRRVLALIAAFSAPALAQPTFTALGTLPGTRPIPGSDVWGVSADGSTVVGSSIVSGHPIFGGTYAAYVWTQADGMREIYSLGGIGTICRAYGVNADGSLVVGMADYGVLSPTQIVAFVWSAEDGVVTEIGDLPGGPSGSARAAARGVSDDGRIIAGQGESDSGAEPFRYTTQDGIFLGLGDLPGGTFGGSAFGISGDGATIVGSSITDNGTQAFRWTQGEGMVGIGHLGVPEGYVPFSEAYGANTDGTVIVGLSRSMLSLNNGWEAFRWTLEDGIVGLGDLSGPEPSDPVLSAAYATTADGSVIVGSGAIKGPCNPFGCPAAPRAFIWDQERGMRDLNVVLPALGLDLGGWVLNEARGISANGRVIVGTATTPQGRNEGWRVDLGPVPCVGDYNSDGGVDGADVEAFYHDWEQGLSQADLNGDGGVDGGDVEFFFVRWEAGC